MVKRTLTLPPCRIKVIGVGGGGCNAVNRMVRAEIQSAEFIAVNTDAQALMLIEAPTRIQIGERETGGLGVGGDPERGRRCAEENLDLLQEAVSGADMIFIAAGMGGGTGTGASPLIAKLAKASGALTIAIVTRPFDFELAQRQQIAEIGIDQLADEVDSMIVIPNERLRAITGQEVTVDNAFKMADDVLMIGVRTISEVITIPGLINLDFADVKSIMKDAGSCWLSIGYSSGANKAVEAARSAISSGLIDVPIGGATGVLYVISGPADLTLSEVEQAAGAIKAAVNEGANIIFGVTFDPSLGDKVRITLIATGFISDREMTRARRAEELFDVIRGLEWDETRLEAPAFARRPVLLRQAVKKKVRQVVPQLEEMEEQESKGLYEMVAEKVEGKIGELEAAVEAPPSRVVKTKLDELPAEVILADNEDTVTYFNKETSSKAFLRARIGKKVPESYPQECVDLVNQILDDFKSGKRDWAEIQIDVEGKVIYIRYLAVRDRTGKYLGCVEVSQQLTD